MSHRFVFLGLSLAVFLAVGAACVKLDVTPPVEPPGARACTEEAKICPDGSAVGRTGPNCEFAPCPEPGTSPVSFDCSGPGDSCGVGYTCVELCGPPVAREDDPPAGYYCERNEIAIQPRLCPICLAANARIATPTGEVKVTDLKVGMTVWSLDAAGDKVASPILAVTSTIAPKSHQVVHLQLADGREVWVSPNHPTVDGVRVGELKVGEKFNDSTVAVAELVSYWEANTYDLLPDSATGAYWANGVLLGSTLR